MSHPTHPTLTEFLLARIAEDEEAARAYLAEVAEVRATLPPVPEYVYAPDEDPAEFERPIEHLARWTPARVLAECAAKRKLILSLDDILRACDALPDDTEDVDQVRFEALMSAANVAEMVIRALASVYADADGFRAEWAL